MNYRNIAGAAVAGLCAGTVNGLFGAGGGMVLIPLMEILTDINEDDIFSSSLAVVLPICVISLLTAAFRQPIPWADAVLYLPGSAIGGLAAGLWGQKIPTRWLRRLLGILIIWGGIRYLCS